MPQMTCSQQFCRFAAMRNWKGRATLALGGYTDFRSVTFRRPARCGFPFREESSVVNAGMKG